MAIVRETGVQISKDDPVMALVIAHDVVLEAYEKRWESFVGRIERRLERRMWFETTINALIAGLAICAIGVALFGASA